VHPAPVVDGIAAPVPIHERFLSGVGLATTMSLARVYPPAPAIRHARGAAPAPVDDPVAALIAICDQIRARRARRIREPSTSGNSSRSRGRIPIPIRDQRRGPMPQRPPSVSERHRGGTGVLSDADDTPDGWRRIRTAMGRGSREQAEQDQADHHRGRSPGPHRTPRREVPIQASPRPCARCSARLRAARARPEKDGTRRWPPSNRSRSCATRRRLA
jgi:hypothetical protein